jgi:hypothetical protein
VTVDPSFDLELDLSRSAVARPPDRSKRACDLDLRPGTYCHLSRDPLPGLDQDFCDLSPVTPTGEPSPARTRLSHGSYWSSNDVLIRVHRMGRSGLNIVHE